MKLIPTIALALLINSNSYAQETSNRTVMIDEAICTYDQYGFPRIKVNISPAIEIQGKSISRFVGNSSQHEMCPDMASISDRLYIHVSLQLDEELVYSFDSQGKCNSYLSKYIKMYIPVPTNMSRGSLSLIASISTTLKETDLSTGYCSDRD